MDDEWLTAHCESLRLASRDSREAATDLAEKVNQHLTACGAAGDHHQGFETRDVLNELVDAWAGHLNQQHVEHAHTIGQYFHLTRTNYADAEIASNRGVSAVPRVS